jgi:hypothetical protein
MAGKIMTKLKAGKSRLGQAEKHIRAKNTHIWHSNHHGNNENNGEEQWT